MAMPVWTSRDPISWLAISRAARAKGRPKMNPFRHGPEDDGHQQQLQVFFVMARRIGQGERHASLDRIEEALVPDDAPLLATGQMNQANRRRAGPAGKQRRGGPGGKPLEYVGKLIDVRSARLVARHPASRPHLPNDPQRRRPPVSRVEHAWRWPSKAGRPGRASHSRCAPRRRSPRARTAPACARAAP